MCVCMYVCMFTYIYIYIYTYLFIFVSAHSSLGRSPETSKLVGEKPTRRASRRSITGEKPTGLSQGLLVSDHLHDSLTVS